MLIIFHNNAVFVDYFPLYLAKTMFLHTVLAKYNAIYIYFVTPRNLITWFL